MSRLIFGWAAHYFRIYIEGQIFTACCPKPFFTISIEQNKDIFAQREKVLCIIYKRICEILKNNSWRLKESFFVKGNANVFAIPRSFP